MLQPSHPPLTIDLGSRTGGRPRQGAQPNHCECQSTPNNTSPGATRDGPGQGAYQALMEAVDAEPALRTGLAS